MKTKHYFIIGIAVTGFLLSSCKKETDNTDRDITAAQDEANASFILQDAKNIADGAIQGQATQRTENNTAPCAIFTKGHDTTYNFQTDSVIEIAFSGTCVSPDRRTRQGDIFVFWNGKPYVDPASTLTMVFRNYSITLLNDYKITINGTRILNNTGKDSLGDANSNLNVNLKLAYSSGATATWTTTRTNTLEQINGIWYYTVTGQDSGVASNGVPYKATITSPLYYTAWWINKTLNKCDCFETGVIEMTRAGKPYPLYLTYTSGTGNCNHTATASIDNDTYSFVLP